MIEKFTKSIGYSHKLAEYKLQYRCDSDCSVYGCPSHTATFTINHAVDTFTIDFGDGQIIHLDGTQYAMLLDFYNRFTND
jgi:hypothetical protein